MSLKLMKQRWLSETVVGTRENMDSNEIVDMEVDDQDNCGTVRIMETPSDVKDNNKVFGNKVETQQIRPMEIDWAIVSGHTLCKKYHGGTMKSSDNSYNGLLTLSSNGERQGREENENKKLIVIKKSITQRFTKTKSISRKSRWDIRDRAELEQSALKADQLSGSQGIKRGARRLESTSQDALPEIQDDLLQTLTKFDKNSIERPNYSEQSQLSPQENLTNGIHVRNDASPLDSLAVASQENKKKLVFRWKKRTVANTFFADSMRASHTPPGFQNVFETDISLSSENRHTLSFVPFHENELSDKTQNKGADTQDVSSVVEPVADTIAKRALDGGKFRQISCSVETHESSQMQKLQSLGDSDEFLDRECLQQRVEQVSLSRPYLLSGEQVIDSENSERLRNQKLEDDLSLDSAEKQEAEMINTCILYPHTEGQVNGSDEACKVRKAESMIFDNTREQAAERISAPLSRSPIEDQLNDVKFVKTLESQKPDVPSVFVDEQNRMLGLAQKHEKQHVIKSKSSVEDQVVVDDEDIGMFLSQKLDNLCAVLDKQKVTFDFTKEKEPIHIEASLSRSPYEKQVIVDGRVSEVSQPDRSTSGIEQMQESEPSSLCSSIEYQVTVSSKSLDAVKVPSSDYVPTSNFSIIDQTSLPKEVSPKREIIAVVTSGKLGAVQEAHVISQMCECPHEMDRETVSAADLKASSISDTLRAGDGTHAKNDDQSDQLSVLQGGYDSQIKDKERAKEGSSGLSEIKNAEQVNYTSTSLPSPSSSECKNQVQTQTFSVPLSCSRLQLLEPNLEEEDMELESLDGEVAGAQLMLEQKTTGKLTGSTADDAVEITSLDEVWPVKHFTTRSTKFYLNDDIINSQFSFNSPSSVASVSHASSKPTDMESSGHIALLKSHADDHPSSSSQGVDPETLFQSVSVSTTYPEDKTLIPDLDASAVDSENPEAASKSISSSENFVQSEPTPYIHLDENIILCDDNLIKEAKVVRCFCEPTAEEIAENRGCNTGCINRDLYTECGSRCPSGNGCSNRRFHNKEYAKVEVFDAGVKGWGLRAAEPLEPGRFIIEYVGEVIDSEEMVRRGRRYGKDPKHVHHYLMALKNGAIIDATVRGNVSRFINHSCDPNCESQKWAVDRHLRVGFFAIKPIAVGEEIVFDYQLERYGRKAQRCFCGAANCRGRIGEDSDNEKDERTEETESVLDDSDLEEDVLEPLTKFVKKERPTRFAKQRRKQTSIQRHNKAITNSLSRGPPRNRAQVRDLVRLMVQVEQAPQRLSLIQCIRFAHPEVLRLFIQECGLRLLYVFLATNYPIDDEVAVLQLQIKSLELLDVMPITTRNQVNDSQLAFTVEKLSRKKGPIEKIVADIMRMLLDIVATDAPSTSYSPDGLPDEECLLTTKLHYEMVTKATHLIEKWKGLREEFRIPRRERSDTPLSLNDNSRSILQMDENERRSNGEKRNASAWRLSGFGPPPKRRHYERRFVLDRTRAPIIVTDLTQLKDDEPAASPIVVTDLTHLNDDVFFGSEKSNKRRSRFDIVGERNPASMYEFYTEDGYDPYAPPPPRLLPESMFTTGLSGQLNLFSSESFPDFLDWNAVYANFDPSSAAYQQFINSYQHYQNVPPPSSSQLQQAPNSFNDLLEAPSPPAEQIKEESKKNLLVIEPIDLDNVTDQVIEQMEEHLVMLKAKRAEQKKALDSSDLTTEKPPPPPPVQPKNSLWVQATTEEGAVYYYNKETRESVWALPDEPNGGCASADTTTDRSDTRATFKAAIVKYVGGILEPIRKLKFASNDDYKYVMRKLTHTILEKELKRVGETELKATDSVKEKARRYVTEYITRLGDGQYSRKNKSHNAY